jgi:peptidoglycan pentaglycine glycine transferase (the first glycine)
MTTSSASEYDRFLEDIPQAHLLQSSGWGSLKAAFGWETHYLIDSEKVCGAQVLFRRLPLGLTFGYIPKGPVGEDWSRLWPDLDRLCRRKRTIFLKVEPDLTEPADSFVLKQLTGFIPSRSIQPRRTIVLSLEGDEQAWLERMKPKTRYNIRLAERKDVIIRVSTDVTAFHDMMLATGARDGFGVHSLEYIQKAYDLFVNRGEVILLEASYQGRSLAGLMAFARGERSWYFYGASNDEERNRMPTYLLQWEAMRWSARCGCKLYDLWGVPDANEDELEAGFTHRSDGLWGVYRFKRGFGGDLQRSAGAWDRVYHPLLYRLIQFYMKRRGGEVGS